MNAIDRLRTYATNGPLIGSDAVPPFIEDRYLADQDEATLFGSKISELEGDLHVPLFDFDFDAYLIASGTEGHFHVYLDKPVEWDKYLAVLHAMADAGLIELGWVSASEARGQTFLRVPWKPKGSEAAAPTTPYVPGGPK